MKLKCIGGLANGRVVNVESYYRIGDIVPVNAEVRYEIQDFGTALKEMMEAKAIANPVYYYKVEEFFLMPSHFRLMYLIPKEWTLEQAIFSVLGP